MSDKKSFPNLKYLTFYKTYFFNIFLNMIFKTKQMIFKTKQYSCALYCTLFYIGILKNFVSKFTSGNAKREY